MPQGLFLAFLRPRKQPRRSSASTLIPLSCMWWPFCPQRCQVLQGEGANFQSCRFSFKKKSRVGCRMKVSEKMAAVEQRRGREGKEDPPLRRVRMVNLPKSILGDEVSFLLMLQGKRQETRGEEDAGEFLTDARWGRQFSIYTDQAYFSREAVFPGQVRRLRRSGVNVRPVTGGFLGKISRLFCLALAKHYWGCHVTALGFGQVAPYLGPANVHVCNIRLVILRLTH